MHLLSFIVPQNPKNAMINIINPITMTAMGINAKLSLMKVEWVWKAPWKIEPTTKMANPHI